MSLSSQDIVRRVLLELIEKMAITWYFVIAVQQFASPAILRSLAVYAYVLKNNYTDMYLETYT